METTVYKDPRNGWEAKTTIDLGEVSGEHRELHITTNKSYIGGGWLATKASVHTRDGMFLVHRFGLAGGGDFSRRLSHTQPGRITEKVVSAQHAEVLDQVQDVIALAREHYEGVAA